MLKELFESIVAQAHKSMLPEQPQLFAPLGSADGREVSYVYGGRLEKAVLPAPPRDHQAASAADLVAIVGAFGWPPATRGDARTADESKDISTSRRGQPSTATLFIGPERVVAILDVARRERVTLQLRQSAQFALLKLLPKAMNQKEAIQFLRRGFVGTGLDNYVTALRQVVFERQQVAAGGIQREKESMGRSIEARVTGTQDLPEFIRGNINVYDPSVFDATWSVDVGVDAKLTEELFEFWLQPDALSAAMHSAQLQLVEYLRESLPGATVVRGVE